MLFIGAGIIYSDYANKCPEQPAFNVNDLTEEELQQVVQKLFPNATVTVEE